MKNHINNKIRPAIVTAALVAGFVARTVFATEYFVNMTGLDTFAPATLTINAGDAVTWVNQDDVDTHTSYSSPASAELWQSPDLAFGETYSRTFNNAGTFPYRDRDWYPAGMTGTITVNNVVPPTLSSPTRPNNSRFQFTISGTAGKTYIIECSGNLTNWSAIATNIAPSNVFNYTNSNATNLTQFYRVKQAP